MPRLSFETYGDPKHPAIMLVHGFMSCNAQWMPNREALSRNYFLVMVELFGHGKSAASIEPADYSIVTYTHEFEQIREQLGIDVWHLIGQSYGAGLVLHYASTCRERCRGIVVTNSRSAFGQVADRPRAQRTRPSNVAFDPRRLPFHPIHARRVPDAVKAAMVRSADAMSETTIDLTGSLASDLFASHLLAGLSTTVLIINGIYEKAFQPDIEALTARYRDLKVARMKGGHSVNIDAADAFNKAVLEFLNCF